MRQCGGRCGRSMACARSDGGALSGAMGRSNAMDWRRRGGTAEMSGLSGGSRRRGLLRLRNAERRTPTRRRSGEWETTLNAGNREGQASACPRTQNAERRTGRRSGEWERSTLKRQAASACRASEDAEQDAEVGNGNVNAQAREEGQASACRDTLNVRTLNSKLELKKRRNGEKRTQQAQSVGQKERERRASVCLPRTLNVKQR